MAYAGADVLFLLLLLLAVWLLLLLLLLLAVWLLVLLHRGGGASEPWPSCVREHIRRQTGASQHPLLDALTPRLGTRCQPQGNKQTDEIT